MDKGDRHKKSTRQKMSASHKQRLSNLPQDACKMCGSLKHTVLQHKRRVVVGRRKSKVWRKAVSDSNTLRKTGKKASARTKRKMSETQLVVQNLPEMKKNHSEKSKVMWAKRTKAQKRAIAEKISKAQRGRIPNFDRYGQYYEGRCGKIWMRSSYEVRFAEWLDKYGIKWKFEPHSFYVGLGDWNGSEYTPDFYLSDHDLYIETKGYLRKENVTKLQEFFRLWPKETKKWYMLKREGLLALGVDIRC